VGVKTLVKTAWTVPLSCPPCVIVPLKVPLPLLTRLIFPFTFWQTAAAETVCADANKTMVKTANAVVANVLILLFIIMLLIFYFGVLRLK
jgi:hypothetical protein